MTHFLDTAAAVASAYMTAPFRPFLTHPVVYPYLEARMSPILSRLADYVRREPVRAAGYALAVVLMVTSYLMGVPVEALIAQATGVLLLLERVRGLVSPILEDLLDPEPEDPTLFDVEG